ncbi:MAG: HD domain-containing phosphohydrolase [Lachnospiraceae bacterium]|nr:HD domain-containing phosphohydrolase [Lachnospiraceae bacterium]
MSDIYNSHDIETSLQETFGETLSHGIVVSNLAYYVAKELGLMEEQCHNLAIAGLLHDIGKLKLRSYVYEEKESKYHIDEFRYVRLHPSLGYALLKEHGYNDEILNAVLYHHENYDGSGYPKNLKGEQIPIGARILHVCDAFGALIANRNYRSAFDAGTAIRIMIEENKEFDMRVFLTFQKVVNSEILDEILNKVGIEEH